MIKDIILVVVLVAILFCALLYIAKRKKAGDKCIGCPHSNSCSRACQQKEKDE